jgi:cell division protein FtsX
MIIEFEKRVNHQMTRIVKTGFDLHSMVRAVLV